MTGGAVKGTRLAWLILIGKRLMELACNKHEQYIDMDIANATCSHQLIILSAACREREIFGVNKWSYTRHMMLNSLILNCMSWPSNKFINHLFVVLLEI